MTSFDQVLTMKDSKKPISVGDIFTINDGGTCTVVEYLRDRQITIQHNDKHAHRAVVEGGNLRKGQIRNPFSPSVFGVGLIGFGRHKVKSEGKKTPAYTLWNGIIQRGYSEEFKRENPSYRDVSVAPEWHNYQCFAEWFHAQEYSQSPEFQLDKDLILAGNREYSPSACSFVPSQINSILNDCAGRRGKFKQGVSFVDRRNSYVARISIRGIPVKIGSFPGEEAAYSAYLSAKTEYVRTMAEEYKPVLHPKVYQNLRSWTL
jgi:hypothetical protein